MPDVDLSVGCATIRAWEDPNNSIGVDSHAP